MSRNFSPFADGGIVKPEDFVGRRDIIEKLEPYVKDSVSGKPSYFLITGEYGIGKYSFLKYLSFHVKKNFKFFSCSCYIEGTVEETIGQLISDLLWDIKSSQEKYYNKIIEDLKDYIINIGWMEIKFTMNFISMLKKISLISLDIYIILSMTGYYLKDIMG